jgi:hypothetical protein
MFYLAITFLLHPHQPSPSLMALRIIRHTHMTLLSSSSHRLAHYALTDPLVSFASASYPFSPQTGLYSIISVSVRMVFSRIPPVLHITSTWIPPTAISYNIVLFYAVSSLWLPSSASLVASTVLQLIGILATYHNSW